MGNKQEAEIQQMDYSSDHRSISKKLKTAQFDVEPYSALAEMIELRSKLAKCVEILILTKSTLDAHGIYVPGIDKVLNDVRGK